MAKFFNHYHPDHAVGFGHPYSDRRPISWHYTLGYRAFFKKKACLKNVSGTREVPGIPSPPVTGDPFLRWFSRRDQRPHPRVREARDSPR